MTFNTVLVGLGKIGYSYDADIDNNNVVLTNFKAIKENVFQPYGENEI